MWRKCIKWLFVVALVLGLAGGAVAFFTIRKGNAKDQVTYQTARIDKGTVRVSVSATGVLQPLTTVQVKSNVGGRIDLLTVDVGDWVNEGDLIAMIDPTDTQAAYDQARADGEGARARETDALTSITAANARAQQAEVNLKLAREEVEQDVAQAKHALAAAQARLAQAEANMRVQPELTKAAISQARATHQGAIDALSELENATIPQARARAKADLDEAEANQRVNQREYRRQQELVTRGFVPVSELDTALARLRSSQAAYDAAKRKWDTLDEELEAQRRAAQERCNQTEAALKQAEENRVLDTIREREYAASQAAENQAQAALRLAEARRANVDVRREDLAAAVAQAEGAHASRAEVQASLKRVEAAITQANRNLSYTKITAPRSGIVLQKSVEQGTVIASARAGSISGTDLLSIGDTSRMFVACAVDETDIAEVRLGQRVIVTVDAYPNEEFEGKVTRIDPQTKVEQNVTTIPVTVEILNPQGPGLRRGGWSGGGASGGGRRWPGGSGAAPGGGQRSGTGEGTAARRRPSSGGAGWPGAGGVPGGGTERGGPRFGAGSGPTSASGERGPQGEGRWPGRPGAGERRSQRPGAAPWAQGSEWQPGAGRREAPAAPLTQGEGRWPGRPGASGRAWERGPGSFRGPGAVPMASGQGSEGQPGAGRRAPAAPLTQGAAASGQPGKPVSPGSRTVNLKLKPGMNANCEFIVSEREAVVRVPVEAIREERGEQGGRTLVKVMVNGKPQEREIKVGLQGEESAEVLSGLAENEEIVTREQRPQDEQRVNSPFGSPFPSFRPRGQSQRGGTGGGPGGGGRGSFGGGGSSRGGGGR